MYWRRELVDWRTGRALRGQEREGADPVNFADQCGVYVLYDVQRPVYVGRAEGTLHDRIGAHTRDRLGGRWDRFSWFGLRPVNAQGQLGAVPASGLRADVVAALMEALLIEAMEPPLNRKRGDKLDENEFLQVPDEDVQKSRLLGALAAHLDGKK